MPEDLMGTTIRKLSMPISNMADLLMEQGKLDEAEPLCARNGRDAVLACAARIILIP